MDVAPLIQPGGSVDGRANQRMTENYSPTQLQQVFRFDGFHGRLGDSKLLRRPPHERRLADWISCCHQQQAARIT
ncbi:MAG: hypothetical protein ABSG43_29595 [Solirubrobacteraceae bacterium]